MRLALLFAATMAASGTWAAGTATGFLPMPGQMLQAVTALGGDPAKVSVGTINPKEVLGLQDFRSLEVPQFYRKFFY